MDHIVAAEKVKPVLSPKKWSDNQKQQVSPKRKFPYFFLAKNHIEKLFNSNFKPRLQKALAETQHTVLTENMFR